MIIDCKDKSKYWALPDVKGGSQKNIICLKNIWNIKKTYKNKGGNKLLSKKVVPRKNVSETRKGIHGIMMNGN